jgi:hypothetical protein
MGRIFVPFFFCLWAICIGQNAYADGERWLLRREKGGKTAGERRGDGSCCVFLHSDGGEEERGIVQNVGNINMQKIPLLYAFICSMMSTTNPERQTPTPHVGGK